MTTWVLNSACRRRKSANNINLVFIPGQNVVLELNVIAGRVLELFANPTSYEDALGTLRNEFEIEDATAFEDEVKQLFDRFVRHEVVVQGAAS